MRIGIDARVTHYIRGGISTYTLRLLRALATLDANSDYVVLHSRKDRHPPLPGRNVRPAPCWTPPHHRLERWTLGMEIARFRIDLLHSPDFIPPAFGYRRSVITVHDLNFLYYPQFLTAESRRYYNQQIHWAVRRADHILADSHATRADLVARLSVPPEKVTTVHLAADPAFHPLPEEEVRRIVTRYGLKPGYLFFVGTLEPRKNVPGLLQAYHLLLERKVTTAPLVLVGGKGWLYDEIFERVTALGLTEQVRFIHDAPDGDLPGLYNGASVLAMPSFYEGFGLPALEAMACGTPVMASKVASLPEVVADAGLLVAPGDPKAWATAMEEVLDSPELRRELREKGLRRAQGFSVKRMAEETLAVYRRVAGQGS